MLLMVPAFECYVWLNIISNLPFVQPMGPVSVATNKCWRYICLFFALHACYAAILFAKPQTADSFPEHCNPVTLKTWYLVQNVSV